MAVPRKQSFKRILIHLIILMSSCNIVTACQSVDYKSSSLLASIESTTNSNPESIEQWYLSNSGSFSVFNAANSWKFDAKQALSGIDIDYFEGMDLYSETRTTIVAVIDTDINFDLFAETGNLWVNRAETPDDELDNDGNGFVDDVFGWNFCTQSNVLYAEDATTTHGNNIIGLMTGSSFFPEYVGILEGTGNIVMGLKAVRDHEESNTQALIDAICYAENNGANICCLALSTYLDNLFLYEIIKDSKMLFVVAAGNDGVELGEDIFVYPAMYQLENVITVADIRCDGQISRMSNFSERYVDVLAPGTDIACISNYEAFEYVSGTSVATAIVTGVCALIRSGCSEELSPGEIKQFLIDSSEMEVNQVIEISEGGLVSLFHCLKSCT